MFGYEIHWSPWQIRQLTGLAPQRQTHGGSFLHGRQHERRIQDCLRHRQAPTRYSPHLAQLPALADGLEEKQIIHSVSTSLFGIQSPTSLNRSNFCQKIPAQRFRQNRVVRLIHPSGKTFTNFASSHLSPPVKIATPSNNTKRPNPFFTFSMWVSTQPRTFPNPVREA